MHTFLTPTRLWHHSSWIFVNSSPIKIKGPWFFTLFCFSSNQSNWLNSKFRLVIFWKHTASTVKFVMKLVLLTLFLLVLVLSTFFLSIKWLTTQDLRQTWPSRRYGEHLLYIQRKTILVIIFLIWSKESNNPILDVSSLQNINQKGGLIPGGVLNFSPSSKKGTK